MQYLINSSAFTWRDAQNGVIPMKAGFRALFLKESAGVLLDRTDEWIDLRKLPAAHPNSCGAIFAMD